jgi:hypothetical protein
MSPRMTACPNCAEHVFSSSTTCPHCDGLIRGDGGRILKTAGAAMLGLALTGCSGGDDKGDTGEGPQPAYGVVDTGDTAPEDSGDQPDYGVPATRD